MNIEEELEKYNFKYNNNYYGGSYVDNELNSIMLFEDGSSEFFCSKDLNEIVFSNDGELLSWLSLRKTSK